MPYFENCLIVKLDNGQDWSRDRCTTRYSEQSQLEISIRAGIQHHPWNKWHFLFVCLLFEPFNKISLNLFTCTKLAFGVHRISLTRFQAWRSTAFFTLGTTDLYNCFPCCSVFTLFLFSVLVYAHIFTLSDTAGGSKNILGLWAAIKTHRTRRLTFTLILISKY